MKKLLVISLMMLAGVGTVSAQEDKMIFNHLGVGLGLGTTGITIDASTTITPYVGVRAGVNIFPTIKIDTDVDLDISNSDRQLYNSITGSTLPNEVDVQGKTALTTGHLLFDVYPFPQASSFHVTAGAYFGASKIVKVYNTNCFDVLQNVYQFNHRQGAFNTPLLANAGKIGADLGDYFLEPDANGTVNASVKVGGVRPYLGVGFGRAVPKNRIGYQFDLGVQFWGKPKVYLEDHQLTESDTKGKGGGAIKTISKIAVWPVLSFRLVGRIL